MKDELKKIAYKLVELEKEVESNPEAYNFDKVFELTKRLSLTDMLEIDAYIQEKNLLTK